MDIAISPNASNRAREDKVPQMLGFEGGGSS